jgi:hypothetical protein
VWQRIHANYPPDHPAPSPVPPDAGRRLAFPKELYTPEKARCPVKRLTWLGKHLFTPEVPGQPEEVLVADARAGLTPADMVESKLLSLLHGASVVGSHLRMGGPGVRGGTKAPAR